MEAWYQIEHIDEKLSNDLKELFSCLKEQNSGLNWNKHTSLINC